MVVATAARPVDYPEDASCKNKRTGSLGMSRDSVLYRSSAYIDTNLCPPQAVLCICHIYIYRLSRSPSLSPRPYPLGTRAVSRSLIHSPSFSLGSSSFLVSDVVCPPSTFISLSVSVYPPATAGFSLPPRSGGGFPTRIRKPEVCVGVCVAPPPAATATATPSRPFLRCVDSTCLRGG